MLNIPADDIKIVNQTTGLLRSKFSNTEIQNIQVLAEKDIRKKVTAFKITEKAETNAKIFLDDLGYCYETLSKKFDPFIFATELNYGSYQERHIHAYK
jgi:hypothetical protein